MKLKDEDDDEDDDDDVVVVEEEKDSSDTPHYSSSPKNGTLMDRFVASMEEYLEEHKDERTTLYEIDFNSFRELPECQLRTLIYRVISFDGHETGISVVVIPSKDDIRILGNDFGFLTDEKRNYLKQQMKDFCKAHHEY